MSNRISTILMQKLAVARRCSSQYFTLTEQIMYWLTRKGWRLRYPDRDSPLLLRIIPRAESTFS